MSAGSENVHPIGDRRAATEWTVARWEMLAQVFSTPPKLYAVLSEADLEEVTQQDT